MTDGISFIITPISPPRSTFTIHLVQYRQQQWKCPGWKSWMLNAQKLVNSARIFFQLFHPRHFLCCWRYCTNTQKGVYIWGGDWGDDKGYSIRHQGCIAYPCTQVSWCMPSCPLLGSSLRCSKWTVNVLLVQGLHVLLKMSRYIV